MQLQHPVKIDNCIAKPKRAYVCIFIVPVHMHIWTFVQNLQPLIILAVTLADGPSIPSTQSDLRSLCLALPVSREFCLLIHYQLTGAVPQPFLFYFNDLGC